MNISPSLLHRIAIHGGSGSGKSWTAISLGEILGHPVKHIDDLFHGPNWEMREKDNFLQAVCKRTQGDRWVIDGNYSKTRQIIYKRCTFVIFLHIHPLYTILQLIKRTLSRNLEKVKHYLPFSLGEFTPLPRNVEKSGVGEDVLLGIYILSISTIKYYFKRFYRDRRWAEQAEIPYIVLRKKGEVIEFLNQLRKSHER